MCHYCKDTGWIREENGHVTRRGNPQIVHRTCHCSIGRRIDAMEVEAQKEARAKSIRDQDEAWELAHFSAQGPEKPGICDGCGDRGYHWQDLCCHCESYRRSKAG